MKPSFKLALAGLALLTVATLVWVLQPLEPSSSLPAWLRPESEQNSTDTATALDAQQAKLKGQTETAVEVHAATEPPSPLAAELHSLKHPPQHDVDTLHALLRQYLRRLGQRQGLPIGNDSDLATVLKGQNPMKYASIPPDHPAFAPSGRLCDRWGTPYFVHPVAEGDFEIRSAGPDRKMFTADDLVADPTAADVR
jgi:hypothetical protein